MKMTAALFRVVHPCCLNLIEVFHLVLKLGVIELRLLGQSEQRIEMFVKFVLNTKGMEESLIASSRARYRTAQPVGRGTDHFKPGFTDRVSEVKVDNKSMMVARAVINRA